MNGPLDGIRIIDITTVILGPFGTQILADMGADVIKVEAPPTGDIARNMGALRNPGMSGVFINMNRNKRSVALDLKQDSAKDVLRALIESADVVVHNMRPQAIARLGFDYDNVVKIKPDIVYVGAYGFGQDGPYKAKPAYDDAIQASSGLASLFTRQGGEARYVPAAMADKIVGLTTAQAISAALVHRFRTGEGQFVEVPMFETMVAFNMVEHINGAAFESACRRHWLRSRHHGVETPVPDRRWLHLYLALYRQALVELLHRGRPSRADGRPALFNLSRSRLHGRRPIRLHRLGHANQNDRRMGRHL